MTAKKGSNRGAIAGLVVLIIGWIGIAVWFFLPFQNRTTTFPEDYFAAPRPAPIAQSNPEDPTTVPVTNVAGFGSMDSIDAFVTQEQGYSVVRSDFGVASRLYLRRDFRMAQEQAELLYARRNEGRQGSVYGGFLDALGQLGKEENVDSMVNSLRGWQTAFPESHFPLMIEAILRMNLADAIRSGKWSSEVGRAASLGFDTNIRQAKTLLEKAQSLQPDDAHTAINLMRVAAALNLSVADMDRYFEYAHERSPQCYAMWQRKLRLLAPQWGGTWSEMSAFMERAEQEAKTNPQVELTVVDGLAEMHVRGVSGIDLTNPDQWQQVADIFARVLAAYPDDLELMSLYAHRAAQFCPDPTETAGIFDSIGDRYFDGGEWESLAQYNQARTHAYVAYARAEKGPLADERMNKAYQLSPDDWYVAYHFGLVRSAQNNLAEAREALLKAVETNPSFVPAINALAHVYLHLEDYENAAIYANRALVRQPLGKLLYEAEGYLADAEAKEHVDAGAAVIPHSN